MGGAPGEGKLFSSLQAPDQGRNRLTAGTRSAGMTVFSAGLLFQSGVTSYNDQQPNGENPGGVLSTG
jgi:hypothetical protein